MLLLIQKYIKKIVRIRAPKKSMHQSENIKNQINRYDKQGRVLMANFSVCKTIQPTNVKLITVTEEITPSYDKNCHEHRNRQTKPLTQRFIG